MANCPNCGSHHIQLKRETDVNWGRAIVGYAVFGIVGGAVGAVTGEDRNVNACLDCGTSWRASDLYNILQLIKNLTGQTLNLAEEKDRLYMNKFIAEVLPHLDKISLIENITGQTLNLHKEEYIPYIKNFVHEISLYINEIAEIEKEGEINLQDIQNKRIEYTMLFSAGGCLVSFLLFALFGALYSFSISLVFVLPIFIIFVSVGIWLDRSKQKKLAQKKDEVKKRIVMIKQNAEKKLNKQVKLLMKKYSIN